MLFSRVCACVPACARAGVFMTSMILLGARWYLRRRWHLVLTLTKADSIKLELNVMGLGSREQATGIARLVGMAGRDWNVLVYGDW